jgi:hypothetical protein
MASYASGVTTKRARLNFGLGRVNIGFDVVFMFPHWLSNKSGVCEVKVEFGGEITYPQGGGNCRVAAKRNIGPPPKQP